MATKDSTTNRVRLGPEEPVVPGGRTRWRQVLIGENRTPIGHLVKQPAPKVTRDTDSRPQIVPAGELWSRTLGGGSEKPTWHTWTEARKALQAQVDAINGRAA